MINKTKNNISFQAGFHLEGTKAERKAFVDFMKNEAEMYSKIWNTCPFDAFEHNGAAVVFTDIDAEYAKKSKNISEYIKNSFLFNGVDFFDKEKGRLFNNIVEFDLIFGVYHKIVSNFKDGIKLFNCESWLGNKKINESSIPKYDFDKQRSLVEGLDIVSKFKKDPDVSMIMDQIEPDTINKYKQAVLNNENRSNINVTGISGAGGQSLVFNIDKDHVFKLSSLPCYPKVQESFDAPIIVKGYDILNQSGVNNGIVYNCISERGKNSFERRMTTDNIADVENSIIKAGYRPYDFNFSRFDQIVKIKGKYHLCDYDCARFPSGSSRLFEAPEAELH